MPRDPQATETERQPRQGDRKPRGPRSMHENVDIWCDCCSCEPEPRWQALADELERAEQ